MPSYFGLTELTFDVVPDTYGSNPLVLDVNGDGHLDLIVPYNTGSGSGTSVPFRIFVGDGAGGFTEAGALIFPSGAPQAIGPGTGVLLADFNGDGRSDVFVNDWGLDAPPFPGSHNVLLLSSGLTGMIDASSSVADVAVDHTYYVSSADIDGDGDIDIFVGNAFAQHVPYFLINDGLGNFSRTTAGLPVDAVGGLASPDGVLNSLDFIGTQSAFFDANGDSNADLLIMSGSSSQPSFLLLGDGHGAFTQTSLSLPAPASIDTLFYAEAVLPGDVNGDGRIDLIVSYQLNFYASGVLQVLINDGGGQFHDEAASRLTDNAFSGTVAYVLKWADVNGDGIQDLFAVTDSPSPSQHAVVYLGDGVGHFVRFPLDIFAGTGIEITDLNGDGRADFVMPFSTGALPNLDTQGIRVLLGQDAGLVQTGDGANNGLMGDSDAETFSGADGDDIIFASGGADTLNGGEGADYLNGGDGIDTASYSDAASGVVADLATPASNTGEAAGDTFMFVENLLGSSFNDTLRGDGAANALSGGDGDDILNGGLGIDTLNGGAGNDTFVYAIGDGNGSMNGGADADTLNVSDGAAGAILNASYDGAALTALSGNALASIETITANLGDGVDWLVYAAGSAAVTVNLAMGSASGFSAISNIERVVGGNANDTLTGNGLDNRLDGATGDDVLAGGGGIDTLIGGDGADTISGGLSNDSIQAGAGNDTISWTVGDGRDTIDGGADTDTFNATGSGTAELGNATWNGASLTALMDNGLSNVEAINLDLGGGVDWLIYNATAAVVVNLATNSASGFASVTNIEKVIGGSGADTLTGDTLDNRLDGLSGADTLDGGAGSDAVLGGDGADVIYASAGNDSLQGQAGNDTFHWTSTEGRDTFNGGADTDTVNLTGSAVADVADTNWNGSTITGLLNNSLVEIELVNLDLGAGGAGGDWLRYNSTVGVSVDLGAGTATGFASITGVENLIGGTGNDSLTGDGGANKINGNNGDDVITGGAGNDNLTGGIGNDTFVYAAGAGNDTINDFDAWAVGGQDFIDVSAFGINAGNFAARVAIIDTGADTVIRIDNTYFITLKNVTGDGDNSIGQADFIFGP